jgi:tetratricopeptide (TPR) repeat protein
MSAPAHRVTRTIAVATLVPAAALAASMAAAPATGLAQGTDTKASQPAMAADAAALRAEAWLAAARTHVPGRMDEPARLVASWEPHVTRNILTHVIHRNVENFSHGNDPEVRRDDAALAKGLVLHTDIAIAERMSGNGAGIGGVRLIDGTAHASTPRTLHLDFGRQLADVLAQRPPLERVALAWYRAVSAMHQQWSDVGAVQPHLDAAAVFFRDDPVLALDRGTLRQAYADARVQSYLATLRRQPFHIGARQVELEQAETELRRAVALDASLVEARIRLADVLALGGKDAEAAALARDALGTPLPPFLDYYGSMVLGSAAARLGRIAEARAAFERAAARYPDAQSAKVALSRIALVEGRPAAGVAVANEAFGDGVRPGTAVDPWSARFWLHEPDAAQRVEDLRALTR